MDIKSAGEQAQIDLQRKAARRQGKLQLASQFATAIVGAGANNVIHEFSSDEVADYSLRLAESILAKWELDGKTEDAPASGLLQ